ncbi:MAG: hypothetical protein P4L85_25215 [Paludisphaera borealis]|uniref:AbrB/MazE/SpoVT family DNA-binding domain-containing protein n=1 Tax=Paludisphaera borealis TaxID=1387353 RepID=UPI0028518B19|nr:hypothetical protein [Paludisphaera borealis]MDR3622677.1 hypothetical protein [Paludisphaera borealis]
MIRNLRQIGNSCGLIIDRPILQLLNLDVGSAVDIALAPDGKGLLLTPVNGDEADAKAAHKARVREAALEVTKRHASALKKLAE